MPYSLCWHLLIKEKQGNNKRSQRIKRIQQTQNLNAKQLISILEKLDDTKKSNI